VNVLGQIRAPRQNILRYHHKLIVKQNAILLSQMVKDVEKSHIWRHSQHVKYGQELASQIQQLLFHEGYQRGAILYNFMGHALEEFI
jgi:hypothetical protein